MGNYRLLPNGNSLVGWGLSNKSLLTEFTASNEAVFELSSATPGVSYRAFRSPWEGHPSWPPALVAKQLESIIRLYFSWNGATEVDSFAVYGTPGNDPTDLIGVVPKDGFEMTYDFSPPGDGLYAFKVVARDASSNPLSWNSG